MSALVQQKYERPWGRADYRTFPRHSVRLVTWNSKDSNVSGAIRTAEAFRIEHVYMRHRPEKLHAAVRTHRWQLTTYTENLIEAIEEAKVDGYTIVALEQTNASIPLTAVTLPERMCLVAGDEGAGVPPQALGLCDMAVEIPQFGMVGSLNVVTAISIALYEWTRQYT